jgi:ankyrin repeat protein
MNISIPTSSEEPEAEQRARSMITNQLRNAITKGDVDKVRALLMQGFDISAIFKYWDLTIALLHSAVSHGNIEIVKLLLAYGHDVNAAALENRRTPLHVAVIKKLSFHTIVCLLLECGADVECKMARQRKSGGKPLTTNGTQKWQPGDAMIRKDMDDWTDFRPLHCAAIYNRPESARHLREYGAEVDCRSAQFLNTPLHLSTVFGSSDVAEVLIKFGADQKTVDDSGFPVFRLGKQHRALMPPRAWGPSLFNVSITEHDTCVYYTTYASKAPTLS